MNESSFGRASLPNRKSKGAEILRECWPSLTCHMSCITDQVSLVTCHMPNINQLFCFSFFFSDHVWKLVGGGLSIGPTPSSIYSNYSYFLGNFYLPEFAHFYWVTQIQTWWWTLGCFSLNPHKFPHKCKKKNTLYCNSVHTVCWQNLDIPNWPFHSTLYRFYC